MRLLVIYHIKKMDYGVNNGSFNGFQKNDASDVISYRGFP
jgi:hypothetical protein